MVIRPRLKRILKRILITLVCIPVFLVVCIAGFIIIWANTKYLYGYVDHTGRFVIPPHCWIGNDFQDGKASCQILVEHGSGCRTTAEEILNTQGKVLDRTEDERCEDSHFDFDTNQPGFSQGSDQYPMFDSIQSPGGYPKYGYRDKAGHWVIPPQFPQVSSFTDGAAWVQGRNIEGTLAWGLINKKGDFVLPPKCFSAGTFHDGLAACRVRVLFGWLY